jgi:hypothetical protein
VSGALELVKTTLEISRVTMSVGTQKGAPLRDPDAYWETGDLRFSNAFYDADLNRLYAAHAIARNLRARDGYVESVVRWYELAPGSPLKSTPVVRRGIVGRPKKDLGWPVVATDALGNLFVNYSRASGAPGAKEFLGAWVSVVPPASTSPETLQWAAGTSHYDWQPFDGERWGDFNAVNRDPLDGTRVWFVNQIAEGVTDFRQVVARVVDV